MTIKPVYQKVLNGTNGDCLSAVWATVLGLKIYQVPHFVAKKDWIKSLDRFVNKVGYEEIGYFISPNDTRAKDYPEWILPDQLTVGDINGYFIATVYSPRFYPKCHAVVIDRNYNIIHDPNPNYKGVVYPEAERLGKNGVLGVTLYRKKV